MTKTELKNDIEKMDAKELLETFGMFLDRVTVSTTFLQNPDGALTHSICLFSCDDKVLSSDPCEFEWPLMVMPKPEAIAKAHETKAAKEETDDDDS